MSNQTTQNQGALRTALSESEGRLIAFILIALAICVLLGLGKLTSTEFIAVFAVNGALYKLLEKSEPVTT